MKIKNKCDTRQEEEDEDGGRNNKQNIAYDIKNRTIFFSNYLFRNWNTKHVDKNISREEVRRKFFNENKIAIS